MRRSLAAWCLVPLLAACFETDTPESADGGPQPVSNPTLYRLDNALAQAEILPPKSRLNRAGELQLNHVLRHGVVVETNTALVTPLPPGAWQRLLVSTGVRRPRKDPSSARVTFEIEAQRDGERPQILFREARELAPGETETDWRDHAIDLTALPPDGVSLVFRTSEEDPGTARIGAMWGSPVLAAATASERPPNVILISIDTLGVSHMGLHGYERDTTPNLEAFARDAVVFDQALTQHAWTLTAHASLLTSLYPDTHRVTLGTALSPDTPLLPKRLRDAGYFTLGLVNNPYLGAAYGYARAYDRYDANHEIRDASGRSKRSIEDSQVRITRSLEEPLPEPFFLFYHLIDTHSDWRKLPYEAPEPFASRFFKLPTSKIPTTWKGLEATELLSAVNRGETKLDTEQLRYFRALYDASIAYTDHHLGEFFNWLRAHDLYRDSLIIVTSDHGEEFLEHGRTLHAQAYDELLRIPLLIKFPQNAWAGTRIPNQVQHIDVVPTVLETLGLPVPDEAEGLSLRGLIDGRPLPPRIAISKGRNHSLSPRDIYVARSPDWKLLWNLQDGRTELYDLKRDPGEQRDVSSQYPSIRDGLHATLRAHRAQRDAGMHLRIPAFRDGDTQLIVHLRGEAPLASLSAIDQNPLRARTTWLEPDEDGKGFTLRLTEPKSKRQRPVGVDFEFAAPGTHFELVVEHEGTRAPRVIVGANPETSPTQPIALAQGASVLSPGPEGTPSYPRATNRPSVYLWEVPAATNPAANLTPGDKEALKSLGYVVE